MYYEEKLINGLLHWRGTPDGEWVPVSAERLSSRVVKTETWRREPANVEADDLRDLRDMFAAFALEGVMASKDGGDVNPRWAAATAYDLADAMMAQRAENNR
jgi:hypothetical protein